MAFNNYLEDENDKPYFTTNSLAYYYDKMEGFAKAVEGSAKALNLTKEEVEKRLTLYIEQNKNELDQRFTQNKNELDLRLAQWDGKLETFDSSVETLLSEWVDDGTLSHVIDGTLIDQKIAPVTAQLTETENETKFLRKNFKPTQIVRHRGWGYAVPENTLPAYELAGKLGDKYVETDILPTSDGVWILMHDDTVDRMTNGTGRVDSLTLAQIRALDVDTSTQYPNLKVPTLEEFLDVVLKWGMVAWIEIKAITNFTLLASLIELIEKKNMEHLVVIISFSMPTLQEVRKRNKLIELGYVTYDTAASITPTLELGNAFINAYFNVSNADLLAAHQSGVDVAVWGGNSQADFERLKKLGVTYFTTDLVMEAK